jgi:hypothetical protein
MPSLQDATKTSSGTVNLLQIQEQTRLKIGQSTPKTMETRNPCDGASNDEGENAGCSKIEQSDFKKKVFLPATSYTFSWRDCLAFAGAFDPKGSGPVIRNL